MTKRKLSQEEQALWQRYTRDIEKTTFDNIIEENKSRFVLKVPKKTTFKNPSQPYSTHHESLKNKDSNWAKKLNQGKAAVDLKIDLHGLTCAQAHDRLFHSLERAQKKGNRVVLVVTGKGNIKNDYGESREADIENNRGVLRREVPMWLSGGTMCHLIVSFQEATLKDGGSGALYVVLKRTA